MTTHAHYVTELNNIFGDNWIITDDLACHLLSIKYKIKSGYNKNINEIKIFYHKQNFNKKLTQSCIINNINNDLIINITKPAFNSEDAILYKITAVKIDYNIKYVIFNNLKIIHPQHKLLYNYHNICYKIIEKMNETIIKYKKQIEYLNKKTEVDNKLISYLQNEINCMYYKELEEPDAKRIKCI